MPHGRPRATQPLDTGTLRLQAASEDCSAEHEERLESPGERGTADDLRQRMLKRLQASDRYAHHYKRDTMSALA